MKACSEKFIEALVRYNGFILAKDVSVGMTINYKVCPEGAETILADEDAGAFAERNQVSLDRVIALNQGFIKKALLCAKVK